jgi:uncharacterized membrane protein YhhN
MTFSALPFVMTLGTAIGAATLVYAERAHHVTLKRAAKCFASVCFVVLGLTLLASPSSDAARWVVIGLTLGAIGDAALLGTGQAAFLGGLSAFLLGHVAYVLAFAHLAAPGTWLSWPVFPVALFGGGVLRWLWSRLGPMRVPVIAYVLVICTMVVAAAAIGPLGLPSSRWIVLGSLLFAVSDVAVARERFVEDSFVNKVWGLPAYYAGQLCLAWAVGAL